MRGISFKVNIDETFVLASILKEINVKNYSWSISEDEIYTNEGNDLFTETHIEGGKFLDKINNNNYSVIFANIKAYLDKNVLENINCYDDFLRSSCKIVILCFDMFYYEIYSKDGRIIETIKSNCLNKGYCDVEYITDENDSRITFSVI